MSSEKSDTTRRKLLKTIGATSLAFGATGVSAAESVPTRELERVEEVHSDPVRARWAAAQVADPVLAELADRGVLERGDLAELDFESVETKAFYADGETVADIATTTEFDGKSVEFVARPQTGRAYATVREDGEVYTVESSAGDDDVTTQACWYENDCASAACSSGGGCVYLERQCCNPCIQSTDDGTTADSCETSCDNWEEVGCCTC